MVRIAVEYNGEDITKKLAEKLRRVSFVADIHGNADSLELEVKDSAQKAMLKRLPTQGDTMSARFGRLNCGIFEVDEVEYNFTTGTMTIRGLSASVITKAPDSSSDLVLQKTDFHSAIKDIARILGLTAEIYAPNFEIERRTFTAKSGTAIVRELCEIGGFRFLITQRQKNSKKKDKLVVFDKSTIAQQGEPVAYLDPTDGSGKIISLNIRRNTRPTKQIKAVGYNPLSRSLTTAIRTAGADATGKEIVIVGSGDSGTTQAAAKKAKNHTPAFIADVTVSGNDSITAGALVDIENAGEFSGVYIAAEVTHEYSADSGYTTQITLEK